MEGSIIKFIVDGTTFQIKKQLIINQIQDNQRKTLQDKIILPSWVSIHHFTLLQKYLLNNHLHSYKEFNDDTTLLIQTLRLTDYLNMYKFQQKFISQIITPSININNCVIFLEETHRKLKNQQNGSQSWYSLLNSSITFLALNIRQVYKISSQKLKRLHEKILSQILDRSIRNGNVQQQMIFQLIMQSKKVSNLDSLFQILRNSIQNKKINPKIHAKLSWKLQDVSCIKDKKTKNFKFLDFDWLLQANRNKNDQLQIKLIYCGIQNKCQIGSFYVKVMWWIDNNNQQKKQQKIRMSYILMNKKQQINILILSPSMQTQLAKSKIQLSIFCSLDQIYTFGLNYLAKNHGRVPVQQRRLTAQQLIIIIKLLKQKKQYGSSIRFMKFLAAIKGQVSQDILSNYPFSQLNPFQIDFLQKMSAQKIIPVQLNTNLTQGDFRTSTNQSRRSEQRPQSRGRLRKIFASSPSRSINENTSIKYEDINKITNIKNYFYDKTNPLYNQL